MQKPEIPEDLTGLTAAELTQLATDIKAWGKDLAAGNPTVAELAELTAAGEKLAEINGHLEAFGAATVAFDEPAKTEAKAEVKDSTPKDEAKPASKAEVTKEAKAAEKSQDAEAERAVEESVGAPAVEAEAAPGAPEGGQQFEAPSIVAMSTQTPETPTRPTRGVQVSGLVAAGGMSGIAAGETFGDEAHLGQVFLDRAKAISGGGTEKLTVAQAFGHYDEQHTLRDGDTTGNLAKMGGADLLSQTPEAITAAVCAPAEPIYDLGCMSSVQRPVRNSMAGYAAKRGAVTVYPNPKLADITGQSAGTGIWTFANDADSEAADKTAATIPCSTPVQYSIYGVYRQMTVTNLMYLTYPELVAAFLNRLAAVQARLAEKTLLTAMSASVNTYNITSTGAVAGNGSQGASVDMLYAVLLAAAVYREQERYETQQMDAWIPRWVAEAIRIDLAMQRRTCNGTYSDRVQTVADITAALRDAGLDVTWTMDDAASWTSVGAQADSTTLALLPTTAKFIFSPKGNFRVLDRGDLAIGVTNNNMYRDNTSNKRNNVTFFFESFEGLVDFGCRSYEVAVSNFNPTGYQVGDISPGGTALT